MTGPAPGVKGWCPGAHRPMMSGDGLVVRVRPRMGRVLAKQAAQLAELALAYGSGVIDLTSRANLQIRGISPRNHPRVLDALLAADLLDPTPELEARRNIVTTPFWLENDGTSALYDAVVAGLPALPALPAKVGIALDCGPGPVLSTVPADFRFERGADGALLLRADGAANGAAVTARTARALLTDLAQWFVASGGAASGRMRRHLTSVSLPPRFSGVSPAPPLPRPDAGPGPAGYLVGAAFGAIDAEALLRLLAKAGPRAIRVTPWRLMALEGVQDVPRGAFITAAGDPLLRVHACPGAPLCSQAEVETRPLARALAARVPADMALHVSGCAKGCAFARSADVTLVGAKGTFDLVRDGAAWDEPEARHMRAKDITRDLNF